MGRLEDMMDAFADLSASCAADDASIIASVGSREADVPGISAGHSCDLYANEELQRRHERTEIMIARALEQE